MLTNLRSKIKNLIKTDSSKEFVDEVVQIDKELDDIEQKVNSQKKEYEEMKTDYIDMVKHTGFKNPQDSVLINKEKTLEEIAVEVIKNKGGN